MASANKKKNGLGKGVNVLFNDSPDELLSVLESEPDKSGRNLLPIIKIIASVISMACSSIATLT